MGRLKFQFLIVASILVIANAAVFNLKLNTTDQQLTKDANYYILDNYFSKCLDIITNCSSGIGIAMNLTLADLLSSNSTVRFGDSYRNVLLTNGGDSSYTVGGFYLHHLDVNNDRYLEFGVTNTTQLYAVKLYVTSYDSMKLVAIYHPDTGLQVYVDGLLSGSVLTPGVKSFKDLRFKPIHQTRFLIERRNQSTFWSLSFYDNAQEALNKEVKVDNGVYLRGFTTSDKFDAVKDLVVSDGPLTTQCRNYCVGLKNQVYALNAQKCSCISTIASMYADYNVNFANRCSGSSCVLRSVYVGSHVLLDFSPNSLGLKITKYNVVEPVEKNTPIAFHVSVNLNNTRIWVNFDDGTVKSFINSGYVVHTYKETGTNTINFTASSLSNVKLVESFTTVLGIYRRTDRSPMESVKLYINDTNDLTIGVKMIAYGGAPFSCNLNYGDNSKIETLLAANRSMVHKVTRQYPSSGIFNISAICRSDFKKETTVSDWKIIYIPDSAISAGYRDPKYSFDNTYYLYVERKADKLPDEIELTLPFKAVPEGFQFDIYDVMSSTDSFSYIHAKRQINLVNFSIKMSTTYLTKDKSYYAIKSNDIIFATYIITIHDKIETSPVITLITNPVKVNDNEMGVLRVNISQPRPYSILRFEYGDGDVDIYEISEAKNMISFDFEHKYKFIKTGFYTAVATLANYISTIQTSIKVPIEVKVSEFELSIKSNVSYVSEVVTFTITKANAETEVYVDTIVFRPDDATSAGINVASDFTFSSQNSYTFTYNYKYTKFGLFKASFQINNVAGSVKYLVPVLVGNYLEGLTAFALNGYAMATEQVKFYVRLDEGTGYDLSVKFSETEEITVPWEFIVSKGTNTTTFKSSQSVQIVSRNLMYVIHQFQSAGEYEVSVRAVSPLNTLRTALCNNITIVPFNKVSSPCNMNNDNTYLRRGDDVSGKNTDLIKVSRKLDSTLVVEFPSTCSDVLSDFSYRWSITSLRVQDETGAIVPHPWDQYCFSSSSSNEVVLPKGSLEYASYNVSVVVVSNSNPSYYRQLKSKIMQIELTKLVAKFEGKSEVELSWNATYELQFYASSYDPEAENVNKKDYLNFYILCSKEFGALSGSRLGQDIDDAVKELNFNFEEQGMQQALKYKNFEFYQKDCFHSSDQEYLNSAIEFDKETFNIKISMTTLNLNESSPQPIVMRLYVNEGMRTSQAEQTVSLNASNSFLAIPGNDLDMMDKQLDKLDDLASKDPRMALNFVSKFADAINNFGDGSGASVSTTTAATNNDAQHKLTNMRGKVLGTMDKIVDGVDDINAVEVAAGATASVTSNADQMPTDNQDKGSQVLEKMGEKAGSFKGMDSDAVSRLASNVLDAGGNVYGAAAKSVPKVNNTLEFGSENETEIVVIELPKKIAAPLKFYEDPDAEEFPEDLAEAESEAARVKEEKENDLRSKTAEIAERSMKGVSGVAGAFDTSKNESIKIEGKSLSLSVGKVSADGSGQQDGPIKMPALGDIFKDGAGGGVSSKLIVSKNNPYQSAGSNSKVGGAIVTLSLSGENGTELKVNGTSKPFVISIPAAEEVPEIPGSVNLLGVSYHKTLLGSNDSALGIRIIPEVDGDIYHVYISYTPNKTIDEYPSETSHDYAFTVPQNDTMIANNEDFRYRIFIPSNETKGNGTYYIGIKLAKTANLTKSEKEINSTHSSPYRIQMFVSSCKYWNVKEKKWSSDGCSVGYQSSHLATECLCYHLTTFGTDFYVPPNTIDFKNVWAKFKNLSDNAAVFGTIIGLLGLYVIVAIWARWMDKRDLIKWGATPLIDNLPTDNYYYLVSVQTGVGNDTSTTSNVGLLVVGEQSDSGVRKLTDGKRKVFTTGSVMNFIMSVEEPLGPLTYLRVWHDNSGKGKMASWYLNLVNVLDIQTNEKFHFVCDKWLAVEKDDGQIDRILPVACTKDLAGFKHLFTKSVKKKFCDGHLWFSVFSRPTKSNFTRLQRISCCLSLLFCTMIANAMFYRADDKNQNKTAIHLGPIKFTMSQLFTSIISTLIVVPVNLIIVTIFRKSKHKHAGVIPTKTEYVARQQYWRRIPNAQNALSQKDDTFGETKKSMWQRINEFCSCKKEHRTIEYRRDEEVEKRNKKQGRVLPYWTIYFAWILCFLSIIVPAFFIILYSMEWGRDRSNAWLTSMMLSFFQSVLVVDPVKVFAVTALITLILRKPDDEDDDNLLDSGDPFYNAVANKDEEFLNTTASLSQINIQEAIQSRRTKLTTLKTMDPGELKVLRDERIKEIKMNEIIREIASYLFFLVILLFLCHQSRHTNSSIMYDNLNKMFLENPVLGFEDVKTRPDFWDYIEKVFLPNLYASSWYNNKTLTWREKLCLSDRYSVRVGAARIRQLRIKNPSCRVSPVFKSIIKGCRGDYNFIDDDAKSYNTSWQPLANKTEKTKSKDEKKCKTSWCYQNTVQTKSVPMVATFATYKGGGYVATLGRTLNKSLTTMNELKEAGWIDQLTRGVFFEFTVFNPNVNLFASATFVLEFLSAGAPITYTNLKVFRLYNYVGSFGILVLAFQIIYIIFLVYFIITEILKIKSEGREYFKQFWNMNELIMIILSIVSIGMYAMKNVFTTLAMKAIRESEFNEFVNFNTIALWDETYTTILACISFCATLKFLKLLRFNKRIGMLASTLKYASGDLKSFTFTLTIFTLAYAQFGYLLFGSALKSYRNFMTSIESVFLLLLGQFAFYDMFAVDTFLAFIYFMTFIFIVFIGLMAIFMTILTDAFENVKADLENQSNDHEMLDYMFTSFKKMTGMDKRAKEAKDAEERKKRKEEEAAANGSSQLKRSAGIFGSSLSMISIRQTNRVEPDEAKTGTAVL